MVKVWEVFCCILKCSSLPASLEGAGRSWCVICLVLVAIFSSFSLVWRYLKTNPQTSKSKHQKPHSGCRLAPLFFKARTLQSKCNVITTNTDPVTYRETGILLFWENTHPQALGKSSFRGGVFCFGFALFTEHFGKYRPHILKVCRANGTFRVYFILDCQVSVSFLNTYICYFTQPVVCNPCFGQTGQCANSSILFTSLWEGFPCCVSSV